jgi:electron transfer flavoprotein alpha subunit
MKTLIIGEVTDSKLNSGTLEIINKANDLGLDFSVVTVGSEDSPIIGSSTFQQTYIKRSSESLQFSNVADKISQIIQEQNISLVLAPSTYQSRDLVSFLSVDLSSSPVSNVINFEIQDSSVITTNSINGGGSIYKTKITSSHSLLLIRPKSFDPIDIELNDEYETIEVENSSLEIFDIFKEEKSGPQLEDSKIVISAGRGMVEKDNLSLVEDLANKLNAAIGGTRAIVDAGWMPYSQQVGQTGKTVKPDVYIACGISGATQHQVGMKDSKFIIAINKDEEAPIFQLADLGIVGDTLSVIPKINENI